LSNFAKEITWIL